MTESIKQKLNTDTFAKGTVLLFLIVIFMALLFTGGVKSYPDTESYLQMSPIRDPGYPLLLVGMTALFGQAGFMLVGLLQNGLAVASVYLTACYIGSKFKKKYLMFLTAFCFVLPYIVTPLFASSGIILTNAMISEGIALPVYGLFVLSLLKALWEEERQMKYLTTALLLAFLLAITRGQMLVTLPIWLITALFIWIKEKKWKKTAITIILFVLALLLRFLTIHSYNFVVNGQFTGTTYGPVTVLSNVIYVADREDGAALREELQPLFYEIYDIAQNGQMLYGDAPGSFSEEAAFYSKMHDEIKDLAIYPCLQDYVRMQSEGETFISQLVKVDSLASEMTKELLPMCIGEWSLHYLRNVAVGLIRTVAFVHPVFNIPAMAGYLILLLLAVYCYHKNRKSKAVKLCLLTALLTAANTAAVALTIMCLSRYMIYNMAFVYITALLLFEEALHRKEEKNHGI